MKYTRYTRQVSTLQTSWIYLANIIILNYYNQHYDTKM